MIKMYRREGFVFNFSALIISYHNAVVSYDILPVIPSQFHWSCVTSFCSLGPGHAWSLSESSEFDWRHGFVLQIARLGRFLLRMPQRMRPEMCHWQSWGAKFGGESAQLNAKGKLWALWTPPDADGFVRFCEISIQTVTWKTFQSKAIEKPLIHIFHQPNYQLPSFVSFFPVSFTRLFVILQVEILQGPLGTPTGHDSCCPSGRPDFDSFCTPRVTQGGGTGKGSGWKCKEVEVQIWFFRSLIHVPLHASGTFSGYLYGGSSERYPWASRWQTRPVSPSAFVKKRKTRRSNSKKAEPWIHDTSLCDTTSRRMLLCIIVWSFVVMTRRLHRKTGRRRLKLR